VTTSSPQPAQGVLGRLATPEHLLHVVEELAAKWRKHQAAGHDYSLSFEDRSRELSMTYAYCKSLAILLDQSYVDISRALRSGEL
jgi:hypothetical protein